MSNYFDMDFTTERNTDLRCQTCASFATHAFCDACMDAIRFDASLQHRTDDLVRAVEKLLRESPCYVEGDSSSNYQSDVCTFCGEDRLQIAGMSPIRHHKSCQWVALQSALAAYKEAKDQAK